MNAGDIVSDLSKAFRNFVNETLGKNPSTGNATAKEPASVEGQAVAYTSLVLMAIIPIFIGSLRSASYMKQQHKSGEKPETITKNDAMKFPIIASGVLFGIYLFFKLFSQEYINLLVSFYFFVLGVFALFHIGGPFISSLIPSSFPNKPYYLLFTEGADESEETLVDYHFDRKDLVAFLSCLAVSAWYGLQKHWLANNLIGLAFATNGIELLHLNSVGTGCILLVGLFFYDIFWVFGTNVMINVAKNFNAPIKVVFPQDFLVNGVFAKNFSMLGLGDIVIPGIFIALLLRFDLSLNRNKKTYFYSGFVSYFIGLVTTMAVMVVFQHPQPALLYLVPCCIIGPVGLALIKGDFEKMFSYSDEKVWEMKKKEADTITEETHSKSE